MGGCASAVGLASNAQPMGGFSMRRFGLAGTVLVTALLTMVASAWAEAPTTVCVHEKASTAVLSTNTKGECPTKNSVKYKSEALPGPAELEKLDKLLPHVNYVEKGVDEKPTIQFSGVNVQILNGEGTTKTTNGEGNLVIGYNELRQGPQERTGSHNLVLGIENNYTRYGGIVGGEYNWISGAFASIISGRFSYAEGESGVVVSGLGNFAAGPKSAVLGGVSNAAFDVATVSGGKSNNAYSGSSVSGGNGNEANTGGAWVGGGLANKATGAWASVSGGERNTAKGESASVSGGNENTAEGSHGAWVGGGSKNTASGSSSSVGGGNENKAESAVSSISGGLLNVANGSWAWVGGGGKNLGGEAGSTEYLTSVMGGYKNKSTGHHSS